MICCLCHFPRGLGENIWEKYMYWTLMHQITLRPLFPIGPLDEFLIPTRILFQLQYDFLVWKSLLEGRGEIKKILVGPRHIQTYQRTIL
jgi:hypothetical protein